MGTWTPSSSAGGGGAQTVTHGVWNNGAGQTVATATTIHLNFVYAYGDALLNTTDPANPTTIAAGVYAVSVYASDLSAATAGATHWLELNVDGSGDDAFVEINGPLDASRSRALSAAVTYYSPAGGVIYARYWHNAGIDQDVGFTANVQRLA